MPQTKKESFIYTIMMCAFMVFFMSIYNVFLHTGSFSIETIKNALDEFLLTYIIGMICDWFIVSRPAKGVAFKFLNENDKKIKKILLISSCMVCGMVLCMSLYGSILNVGFTLDLPRTYLIAIGMNVIVALPLQLIIAGPIIRFLFSKVCSR
ncbi:DUF2798 domain-containing protein [Clostridium sp. SHJSY1]|uniref:DUF2798 domain-containing protein n=1 Tax=Clostridium sp. SHJSY1 TaxID=2942483 RepID=UPI00287559D5|nr:DUF2798 domain-containing protein [Clostridium sp. SHJSY1]MDS0525627.1 DUF2798 domain-containing protein [Clostridium sp. SHJSY1]